ncbi:Tripartite tricarboxylate transporter TctB family protein [Monaibacterium marinum]|uniref:Tripartite tricarboxylate transporter TctB family protein n=1 Tax=Pontivivens marinum TaxID=1690039 RepID=A0A2C9CRE6_9RHOB|nr:tripartite tricarboxylate transporter TctB family protein [Monaibacterium marinum]SOH93773.1 Tripartite tricarboxylate transporter TctB family protein [Monaibacterium marinum]
MSDTDIVKKQEAGKIALLLSYVFLFLCSVGLFITATAIPASRFEKLGAGAFPKLIFAIMALVAAIAFIGTIREIPRSAYANFIAESVAWAKRCYLVFVCLGALTVYLLLIPVLGFSIASLLFLFGLQVALMPRTAKSIALAAVIAVVFSFGLNWVFAEVFTVFLPRGVL